jgi:hypothetical protein
LAAELARVLDVMAAEVQGEHPVRLPLPDLRARLAAEVPHFPALAADVAAEDAEPPRPAPRDVRAGVAHRWPDLGAWHIVREIAQAVRAYQGSKSHGSRAGASSSPRTSSSTDMAVHVVPNEVHPGGAIEVHPADVDVHADPRTAPRRARAG